MKSPDDDWNVSKRINVTLPDVVVDALERWADAEGRPTANLAAFLIEKSVREAEENGKIPQKDLKRGSSQ